ncbi:MAG: hypothetical protein V2A78_10345 [bacterium]
MSLNPLDMERNLQRLEETERINPSRKAEGKENKKSFREYVSPQGPPQEDAEKKKENPFNKRSEIEAVLEGGEKEDAGPAQEESRAAFDKFQGGEEGSRGVQIDRYC